MIHARRTGQPSCEEYFPATIAEENGLPIQPGRRTAVTITVVDDQAPAYFSPGQAFTLWGESGGRGVVTRRVFTDYSPS